MRENFLVSILAEDLTQVFALYLLAGMTKPVLVAFICDLVALLRINIGNERRHCIDNETELFGLQAECIFDALTLSAI